MKDVLFNVCLELLPLRNGAQQLLLFWGGIAQGVPFFFFLK
jgi:hypothetical protein